MSLGALVRFLTTYLGKAAKDRAWGQIVITIKGGQIEHVGVTRSYKTDANLPTS